MGKQIRGENMLYYARELAQVLAAGVITVGRRGCRRRRQRRQPIEQPGRHRRRRGIGGQNDVRSFSAAVYHFACTTEETIAPAAGCSHVVGR